MTLDQFRTLLVELRSFDRDVRELVLHPTDMANLLGCVEPQSTLGVLDGVRLHADEEQEQGTGTFLLGGDEERRFILQQGSVIWRMPSGFVSSVFIRLRDMKLKPYILRMDEAMGADTRWRLQLGTPRYNGFFGRVLGTALLVDEALPQGVVFAECLNESKEFVQLVFHAFDPESPFEFLSPDPNYPDAKTLPQAIERMQEHVGWMTHRTLRVQEGWGYDHPHVIHRITCADCDFEIGLNTRDFVAADRTDLLDPEELSAEMRRICQTPARERKSIWDRLLDD